MFLTPIKIRFLNRLSLIVTKPEFGRKLSNIFTKLDALLTAEGNVRAFIGAHLRLNSEVKNLYAPWKMAYHNASSVLASDSTVLRHQIKIEHRLSIRA